MIQRDVDATLPPNTYEVHVSEWTFVPTSSNTPDTPAYYISRVRVVSDAGEVSEDAIIPMHDLPAGDRAALEALVRRTVHFATRKAKARLEDSRPPSEGIAIKRHPLRRVAPRAH